MVREDGIIRTDDLTFAVVLTMHGFNPVMEKDGHTNKVVWVLDLNGEDDEFVDDLARDYLSGASRVEPKRFMREARAVRKEMYRFLGIGNQPPGTPIPST